MSKRKTALAQLPDSNDSSPSKIQRCRRKQIKLSPIQASLGSNEQVRTNVKRWNRKQILKKYPTSGGISKFADE